MTEPVDCWCCGRPFLTDDQAIDVNDKKFHASIDRCVRAATVEIQRRTGQLENPE